MLVHIYPRPRERGELRSGMSGRRPITRNFGLFSAPATGVTDMARSPFAMTLAESYEELRCLDTTDV